MLRRQPGNCCNGTPSIEIVPWSGESKPLNRSSSVVLPEPEKFLYLTEQIAVRLAQHYAALFRRNVRTAQQQPEREPRRQCQ